MRGESSDFINVTQSPAQTSLFCCRQTYAGRRARQSDRVPRPPAREWPRAFRNAACPPQIPRKYRNSRFRKNVIDKRARFLPTGGRRGRQVRRDVRVSRYSSDTGGPPLKPLSIVISARCILRDLTAESGAGTRPGIVLTPGTRFTLRNNGTALDRLSVILNLPLSSCLCPFRLPHPSLFLLHRITARRMATGKSGHDGGGILPRLRATDCHP